MSAGVIDRANLRVGRLGGGLFQVKQRLMCQFGYDGIGVAQQIDEEAKPGEFLRFNSDDWKGVRHGIFTGLFDGLGKNVRSGKILPRCADM